VLIGVSASFAVMPFGQYLIAADLDVGILYVLAVTSLVTLGLLSSGWASGDEPSLLSRLRSVVAVVSYGVPGAVAVACIVMMTGSLRLQEIIHAQGGWPWEWFVFKSPVTFAAFCLFFTTSLANGPAPLRPELERARARGDRSLRSQSRYVWFLLAERASTFVMCGIAAALFMGGWQVPGLSTGAQEAHIGLQLVGALVFLVKAWTLIVAVLWARWTWPRMRVEQRLALCWKWLVPTAFAAFALSAAWVAWSPTRGVQTGLGASMFSVFCVASARFAVRVRYNLRATSGEARLNPFL
jgi:NADH-quinone oxidoreductase subunit H